MKYQHTALKPDTEHSQSQHLGIRLAVEHMNDGIRKHEDYRTDSNRSKHSDGTAEYVAFPDTFPRFRSPVKSYNRLISLSESQYNGKRESMTRFATDSAARAAVE